MQIASCLDAKKIHEQRSSLSRGSFFSESFFGNSTSKINWDFGDEVNNIERHQFVFWVLAVKLIIIIKNL